MSAHLRPTRRRGIGLVVTTAGLLGLLAAQFGLAGLLDLLETAVLAVLYITVPVAVLAALLTAFFRFNAWRHS